MPLNKPIQKQYFSITEVAEKMGLNASQLRYWEKEFTALKPKTNARGKRFYNQSDIEIIGQINWLVKDQGYTISGARKAMRKRSEVAGQMASAARASSSRGPAGIQSRNAFEPSKFGSFRAGIHPSDLSRLIGSSFGRCPALSRVQIMVNVIFNGLLQ